MASGEPASDVFRLQFREPDVRTYLIEPPNTGALKAAGKSDADWLKAWAEEGSSDYVKFGKRIVLELRPGSSLAELLAGTQFRVARVLGEGAFIIEGRDVREALQEAARLAEDDRVSACYPVAIRPKRFYSAYAAKPNDPYFHQTEKPKDEWQAYLENRGIDGSREGPDLNVRSAWSRSRGQGVLIAIADDGVELSHPDLAGPADGAPHFNFINFTTDGYPTGPFANHGTAVAGLAAARGDNRVGIIGVAPEARLASWVLFSSEDRLEVSDEALMDMFQYKSNIVSVQNHSWGKDGEDQFRLTSIENRGISNAVTFGRSGRGVVIVRAGGNGRMQFHNSNDDGYLADPRVIAVAAARMDGRVTRYSTPGANLLVAAVSGDVDPEITPCEVDSPNLMTTDRQGTAGYNFNTYTNDLGDYAFGPEGFSGTSAATPLISGVAALVLSTNPALGYRDVQQILIHSARHFDLADPDLKTNAAGFQVSHNLGFGIPDAGMAVRLAQAWPVRPPPEKITYSSDVITDIPDQGMRVVVTGGSVPPQLQSIVALPSTGSVPDTPTEALKLRHVGTTISGIEADLTGNAALIQRGGNYFCEKVSLAAAANAGFAIVYNNRDVDARIVMGAVEFAPIPSVFISQQDGEALRDYVETDADARAQLIMKGASYTFDVRETLICEHIGVVVDSDHNARGDLRISLESPNGTRSVLQNISADDLPGPRNWTYYSTHQFYESSAGKWTVTISDLDGRGTGKVRQVKLLISGVAISDSDRDGLDDGWESRELKTLGHGPQDDPDRDGYSNAREQAMGTRPLVNEIPFQLDISVWNSEYVRLSWPGNADGEYRVRTGGEAATLLNVITNIPGTFPETEWFVPMSSVGHRFFQAEFFSRSEKD